MKRQFKIISISFIFSILISACGAASYSTESIDGTEEYVTFAQTRENSVRLSDIYENVDIEYMKETASNAISNGVKSYFGFFYSLDKEYPTDLRPLVERVNSGNETSSDDSISDSGMESSNVNNEVTESTEPLTENISDNEAGNTEESAGMTKERFEENVVEGTERIIKSTESMIE